MPMRFRKPRYVLRAYVHSGAFGSVVYCAKCHKTRKALCNSLHHDIDCDYDTTTRTICTVCKRPLNHDTEKTA